MINMIQMLLSSMILQRTTFTFLSIVICLQFYIRCTGKVTILDDTPFKRINIELTRFSSRTQTTAYLDFFQENSHEVRPIDNLSIVVTIKDRKLAIVVSDQTLLSDFLIKRGSIRSLTIKSIKLFTDVELAFPLSKKTTLKRMRKWRRDRKYCERVI